MTRIIIIIGEGQTEQEFCNDVLQSFFNTQNKFIETPTIKKTKGGIVSWNNLKKQIELHLRENAYVTTLIDYYGIHSNLGFPKWEEAHNNFVNKSERITFLEDAMKEDIDKSIRCRFIPYIQLHEFEALLFSDISVIKDNFDRNEFKDHNYLTEINSEFNNPEDINNSKETAPSKRLNRIIKEYNKVTYGSLLAQEIGLAKIRNKCPRFNDWIDKLSAIA